MRALLAFLFVALSLWKQGILCAEVLKCSSKPERFIGSTEASADFFSNARSAKGSLQYESKRFLGLIDQELLRAETGQKEGAEEAIRKSNIACQKELPLVARLRVRPRQYLRNDPELQRCDEYAQDSTSNPLIYDPGPKDSMKKIRKWFTAFSQGENQEGEQLYKDCPGRCSPQYTLYLYRDSGHYRIQAQVVCGRPRDQYDNHYVLSVGVLY